MVVVITRKKGSKTYYYLRHDDGRIQRETYLGRTIPKNIQELSRNFYLKILRESWQPAQSKIQQKHSVFLKNSTKAGIENYQEIFSYDFTHDTNKIEGSSLTKQETYKLLRFKITPAGKPESDMIEAKTHHVVFLDMLHALSDISLKNTLDWHGKIFKDTLPHFAGKIRNARVVVTGSKAAFPHPNFVPALLKQFYKWYDMGDLNPVELAGLAHFRFVSIHPFGDGNGRISRLLMNNVLNKHRCPMLNIKYSDRHYYYSALEKAQLGLDKNIFLKWFIKYYMVHSQR